MPFSLTPLGVLGDDGLPIDASELVDPSESGGSSENVPASEVELRLKSGQYYSKILFKRPNKRKEAVICPSCGKESKEGKKIPNWVLLGRGHDIFYYLSIFYIYVVILFFSLCRSQSCQTYVVSPWR